MIRNFAAAVLILFTSCLLVQEIGRADSKNSTAKKREKADLGTKDFSGESRFTGDVAFSIPVGEIGGVSVAFRYNSNVHKLIPTDNRYGPSGWVGLGWKLSLGCVQADNNNTKDPSDDKYFYIGPDATSELIVDSGDVFMMRDYRHWLITRQVSDGTIVGWTITTEDGTVFRYGNYDKATGLFSLDSLPTHATRSQVACGNLVEITIPNATASLVPYQWDLSDVEDINQDHTTILYQQVRGSLAGTSLLHTVESYPKEIIARDGRRVEFSLHPSPILYFDSPLVGTGQIRRETRSLKQILVKDKRGLVISGLECQYDTMNIWSRSSLNNKKIFLKRLVDLDGTLDTVRITTFDYAGVSTPLGTGDHNPGALTRISLPEGGGIGYEYRRDTVITNRSPLLVSSGRLWSSWGAGRLAGDHDYWSMSGSDFFVIWQGTLLQAYRWSPENKFVLDGSFPFANIGNTTGAGYWVQNDYVVCKHDGVLEVAKRSGEGWRRSVIDSGVAIGSLEMLGLGNDYFVYAVSCSYNGQPPVPITGWAKVATWQNTGSWSVQALGERYVGYPCRILCGTRFFASTLDWPVFVYNPSTGIWDNTGFQTSYGAAAGDCLLRQSFDTEFNIMKWDGSSWSTTSVGGPPYPNIPGASLIAGNNFFLIRGNTLLSVATNTTNGWRAIPSTDLLDSAIIEIWTKVAVGPDFFVITWREPNQNKWKVGVVPYKDGQWQTGSIVAEFPARALNGVNREECTPVVSGSTLFVEIYEGNFKLELYSLVRRNDIWDVQQLADFDLGWWTGYENPLKPFMQPGSNFTVCIIDSNLQRFGDGTLLAWKRSYGPLFREAYSDTVLGGLTYSVAAKTSDDGMGNCTRMTFEYKYGSFDDDIATARFNKSTTALPGIGGKKIVYSYNDLGSGQLEIFLSNPDYRLLDGNPYLERDFDKDGNLRHWRANEYVVVQPGAVPVNGILNPYFTTEPGEWLSTVGAPLHTAIDDGATLDPNDWVYTFNPDDAFWVKLQSPGIFLQGGTNVSLAVDARPAVPDSGAYFFLLLYQDDGSGSVCLAETLFHAPAYSDFQSFAIALPAEYIGDASGLFAVVELLSLEGRAEIARIKFDYQGKRDRGTAYSRTSKSTTSQDGVETVMSQEYNPTNGLVRKVTETSSEGNLRVQSTKYAYERIEYSGMSTAKHMLSQVYSTTVSKDSSDVEERRWTMWGDSDGTWRPREEWAWRGDGSANDLTAPDDPEASAEAMKFASYLAYDTHGNLRQKGDGNGVSTTTVYGYDSTRMVASVRNAAPSEVYVTVFDDSTLTGWSYSSGTWGIVNGVMCQTDGSATGSWNSPTANTLVQVDNAIIEADVWFDNAGDYRYVAVTKVVSSSSYVRFECRKSENLVRIHAYGPNGNVYSNGSLTFSEKRWYHLRGEVQGQTATFYVDGKKVVELTSAAVDQPAGYPGLCTFGTVASFDNVRFYPTGAQAQVQIYDRKTLLPVGSQDENGVLQSIAYDSFNRKVKTLVRSEGKNLLGADIRYSYSKRVGDIFEKGRPNAVELSFPAELNGYSDFSTSDGWTVGGGDITFGVTIAGETAVRLGTGSGSLDSICRVAPSTHAIARVDFYADDATDGTPHVLAFASGGYRFCVQYDPTADRFRMQTRFGAGVEYPLTFDLPAPPNRWYTVELEKTDSGDAYAYVFPRGGGRISKSSYFYYTSGFPMNWGENVVSCSNDDYFYLAHFYAGLPDRSVSYYDGLGRPIQSQRGLKNSTLIESSAMYDSSGRPFRTYKGYQKDFGGSGRHRFDTLFAANSDAYYNAMDSEEAHTGGYPFSETQYHPDPLGRVWKQGSPGSAWRLGGGHERQSTFGANGAYDLPGYGVNTHFKTIETDEDSNVTWNFTDRFGRKSATVVDPFGLNLCTQMQYDLQGNLTASITPRGDTTRYRYSPLRLLTEKTTPDQGTSKSLYDKLGKVRLVKDAAHTGTSANNVYLTFNEVISPYSSSGQFTLNMPGRVNVDARVYEIQGGEVLTIRIKTSGTTLKTVQTYEWSGANGTIILPKGTYSYEIQATGESGQAGFGYTISCQTGFEFIYHKYDAFSRPVEVGEYESSSASGNFTQANAESTSFPVSNTLVTALMIYDSPSPDAHATGQRNIFGRLSAAKAYRLGTLESTTSYSYDHSGNVEWVVQTSATGRWWQLKYEYDVQGRVTKKSFLDGYSSSYNLYTFYEYDQMGRLSMVFTSPNADTTGRKKEAEYAYYAGGPIKRIQLAQVQGVDYRYNTRDWLTMINHQNLGGVYQGQPQDPGRDGYDSGFPVDRFGMIIGYNDVAHIGGAQSATAQYGGNISWAMYNMSGVTTQGTPLVGNSYSYDNANRLAAANFGYYLSGWQATPLYDETGYTYDANGNILAFKRNGHTGATMDSLTYVYSTGTNRLRHILDGVSAGVFTTDIDNQQADNYGYDGNGSLQKDVQRDIGFVVNDINNLPVAMWKTSTGAEIKYYYDAEGRRIRKDGSATEYYVNGIQAESEAVVKGDESGATHNIVGLDALGQVKRSGSSWSRFYYLKDHLGTVKLTVDTSAAVVGYDDYYPFGMQMEGRCYTSSADDRYKFTGKERDVESQYDYFGARYYDSRVGRWLTTDPLAEKYAGWSPYTYVLDNPLLLRDPDGKAPVIVLGGVALTAGEATVLVCAGIAATASAVGADNTAKSVRAIAGFVDANINKPIVEALTGGIDWIGSQISSLASSQAPPANDGEAKQHGDAKHDAAINKEIEARKESGHTDIRKNQAQVNAEGEKVGTNRPDVQSLDEHGKRDIKEFDRTKSRSQKHLEQIKKNDPNARAAGEMLK